MSINAGTVYSELVLDSTRFTTGIRQARSSLVQFASGTTTTNTNVTSLGNRLASVGKKMTKIGKSMTTFVTAPILAAGAASVKLASDMNESANKVEVAFGKSADSVKRWSDTTLKGYGIAKGTSLDMAALFGDMATSMDISQEAASKMSMSLVGLAGDLSSFKNIGIKEAETALNGIFTGETESLKRLGIVMTEVNLQNYALSKGIKTKIKDMKESEKVQLRYNYVLDKTKNAHGDFARTQSGTANQMRIFTESLKELGASFGQHILPVITPIISKTNQLVQAFGKLDDKTKKTILTVAGITAVVGPTILVFGKMATAVSSIMTLFGGFAASSATAAAATTATTAAVGGATAATGGFAAALAFITGPIGLTIGAIALLTAGGIALYKHMKKDSIPAVNLFGKTTSEATKKAVGAYMDLDNKASKSLMALAFNSEKITKENSKVMVETFDSMGQQIKEGMQKNFNESYKTMEDFFESSGALTQKEETEILADMKTKNSQKQKEIDSYNQRIKLIMEKAADEKRALTQKEQQEINALQEKMRTNAVKSLSATELESKAILERMRQQASNLTAKQASEVVKNSKTQKDKAVKNAEEQYNKTIKAIIKQRDETGSISKSQADKLIKEAKRQRDESVKKATDMHKTVVGEAKKQAKGHVDQVNWETGQILSKWQVFKNNMSKKWDEIKSNAKAKVKQIGTDIAINFAYGSANAIKKINELKTNSSRKWDEIKSNARTKMNQAKDAIWRPIEQAKTKVSGIINKIKGFFNGLKLKIPSPSMPKMPRFTLETGSKSVFGKTITYPTGINVDWYDKGGIFNSPQIIGVGERRPEFVGALDDLRYLIRDELRKSYKNDSGGRVIHQTNNFYSPKALDQAEINRLAKRENQKLQLLLGAEV